MYIIFEASLSFHCPVAGVWAVVGAAADEIEQAKKTEANKVHARTPHARTHMPAPPQHHVISKWLRAQG